MRNHNDPEASPDSRFNLTLKNVQGLLKGRIVPGKVLLTRRSDLADEPTGSELSPASGRSLSDTDAATSDRVDMSREAEARSTSNLSNYANSFMAMIG